MIGYFDGSCEPINPGGTAKCGWVILDEDGSVYKYGHRMIGTGIGMTNNVAEYDGLLDLLWAIRDARKEGGENDVEAIYGDSLMVVNMVTGQWGKKNPHKKAEHLKERCLLAREMIGELEIEVRWIPREQNTIADYYSKL